MVIRLGDLSELMLYIFEVVYEKEKSAYFLNKKTELPTVGQFRIFHTGLSSHLHIIYII